MGEDTLSQSRKRKTTATEEVRSKRARKYGNSSSEDDDMINDLVPGKVMRIFLKNFMCHDALEMKFNPRINFLVGQNGSGKSAILTALTVGLGAKARDTDRGASLKGFVKQGKNSATVEITITNRGDGAYQWDIYGDSITVVRTFGATSSYKTKSHNGETISTKKDELIQIVNALNIQVDNPISILNQDTARSFLMSNKPEHLYQFYMRATRLDFIGDNYRKAVAASDNAKLELKEARKYLTENEVVIEKLTQKIEALESLDTHRQEYQYLEKEALWAAVIEEEKMLLQIDKNIDYQNKDIEKLENIESTKVAKEKEINSNIEALKMEIAQFQAEAAESNVKSEETKKKAMMVKKIHEEKREKTRKFHKNIKEKEADLQSVQGEIKKLEREQGEADNKRQEARQRIEEFEQQLDEVEATLRTKQTDRMHLEENRNRICQEENKVKIDMDQKRIQLNKERRKLQAFETQPNDALAVYGRNIPRLVRRIEEEHKRNRFRRKPIGPLGAFISIKEPSWIPAIETHLGAQMLKSFCVDNHQDAKVLNMIIKEIFQDEYPPMVITSKFFESVHNVEGNCTRSPQYRNILDMMDITNVTVANTLIDQREVECVLLIPTSEEACKVMSDYRQVPRNCRRAYTKNNDLFYPDPNYKTYGGQVTRPKFLQVSTGDAIISTKEDIRVCEDELRLIQQQYTEIQQKKLKNQQEYTQVQQLVKNLSSKQSQLKTKLEENREILGSFNNNIINAHIVEVEEITKWLTLNKEQEARMMEEYRQSEKELQAVTAEYKKCRELATNLDATLNPIKEKINELKDEQKRLDVSNKGARKRLQEAKQILQKLNGEHQQQQRVVTKKTDKAQASCSRIDSTRSAAQINNRVKELKRFIEDVQNEHGDVNVLKEELEEHKEKYHDVYEFACNLETANESHNKRLRNRKIFYSNMKADIAKKVHDAFSNILLLRNYKGSVTVDHKNKKLELEMSPINDAKRQTNDAKTLSGGERSYSTIGFILALWQCTGLPFYFLDEFDVFMDKVNRRIIIDILIDHAMTNPRSQFTFLTPLDASHVTANNSITIHRMAPPERIG